MKKSGEKVAKFVQDRKRNYWECLRRNSSYVTDYSYWTKLNENSSSKHWEEKVRLSLEMAEKYRLVSPIDPKVEFNLDMAKKISYRNAYIKSKIGELFLPIESRSFQQSVGPVRRGSRNMEPSKRSEYLEDGQYLQIFIDVDTPLDDVREISARAVKCARETLEDDVSGKAALSRLKPEENIIHFKVWDMYKKGIQNLQIGRELWGDRYSSATLNDKVYKSIKRAEKLIESVADKPLRPQSVRI